MNFSLILCKTLDLRNDLLSNRFIALSTRRPFSKEIRHVEDRDWPHFVNGCV